jgi:hypothetical protein
LGKAGFTQVSAKTSAIARIVGGAGYAETAQAPA